MLTIEKEPDWYSGFIVVRLEPALTPIDNEHQSLTDVCEHARLDDLKSILVNYSLDKKTQRLILGVNPETLIGLEKEAQGSNFSPNNSLAAYWRIDSREYADQIQKIVAELQKACGVNYSYPERRALPATAPATSTPNPYTKYQGYLNPAKEGIDARWAWTLPGGEGTDVKFVDLELAWNLKHEDYATRSLSSASLLHGDISTTPLYVCHGTNTLGVVLADDNQLGIKGIAPKLTQVKLSSAYDASTNSTGHIASAIVSAICGLDTGDVLLVELQRCGLPVEIDAADFDALRLAVASGIVVIEAAGNAGKNLDSYCDESRGYMLNPNSKDYQGDSGVTIVGSSESPVDGNGHKKMALSNSGKRVNCYAWGENVVSCGGKGDLDDGGGDANKRYTKTYGGTSSASAIIAGAAVLLQGVNKNNTSTSLSSLEIRSLLSKESTGTKQSGQAWYPIGVMPNLRAIVEGM